MSYDERSSQPSSSSLSAPVVDDLVALTRVLLDIEAVAPQVSVPAPRAEDPRLKARAVIDELSFLDE